MARRALRAAVVAAALPRPAARHVSCDVFNVPLSVEIELGCTLGSSQACKVTCRADRNYVGTPTEISCPPGFLFLQGHFPVCTKCDVATDCSGHAEEVWATPGGVSCACRCTTGYRGDRCNGCAPSYVGYPACSLDCSVAMDCSGHGVGVSDAAAGRPAGSCACACTDGYAGTSCGECEAGRGAYPGCALLVPTMAPTTAAPTAAGTPAYTARTAPPGPAAPPATDDGAALTVAVPAVMGGLCVIGLCAVAVRMVFCRGKAVAAAPAGSVEEPPPRRPPSAPPSMPDASATVASPPPRAAAKRGTRSSTSSGPPRSPRPASDGASPPAPPVESQFQATGFCQTTPDGAPLRAGRGGGGARRKSRAVSITCTPPPSPPPHQARDLASPQPRQSRDLASPQPRRSDDRRSCPTPTSTRSKRSRGSSRGRSEGRKTRSCPSLDEMQVVEADRCGTGDVDRSATEPASPTAARVNKYLANVGAQLDTGGKPGQTLNPLPPADRAEVMRLSHKIDQHSPRPRRPSAR